MIFVMYALCLVRIDTSNHKILILNSAIVGRTTKLYSSTYREKINIMLAANVSRMFLGNKLKKFPILYQRFIILCQLKKKKL